MFTSTLRIIATTQLRKCPWGAKKGLINRGLRVLDIATGEQSWINNFRTDVLDPTKGQYIRWDGRNVLCLVEADCDDEF